MATQYRDKTDDRPQLGRLRRLHKGDTLAVWKLDRLGRNLKHLIETSRTCTGAASPWKACR
jgi:DNA invertase Pin-like site-specific DNA recombinase